MVQTILPFPSALVVGHPGHELRLFHWLEQARPVVFVLTDGSGSGHSRIPSTVELLATSGSTPGPVLGALTDTEMYDAILRRDVAAVAAVTEAISDVLIERRVRSVVADAFEFYNPTHDLCAVVATLAAARAQALSGTPIQRYDYAVTQAASGEGIVLDLESADVDRKLAAAYRFENLTGDVTELLAAVGRDELAREILRPVSMNVDLPVPDRKPHYEVHGEKRVASGRYARVLRYDEHFVPFVEALAAAVGQAGAARQRVQASTA